jgi:replication factor A1
MINIPYDQIVAKIKAGSSLSESEIHAKVNEKLEQLAGLVTKEGAAHIVANELSIRVYPEAGGTLAIKDISAGMRNVTIAGRVVKKYEAREFKTEKREGKVANLLLGDDTGLIRAVFWNEQVKAWETLQERDTVRISNAYARDNNGRPEIHLNDNTKVERNPEGLNFKTRTSIPSAERKQIKDLTENEQNAEILATIVQAFDPAFFEVCPQCGKRAQMNNGQYTCQAHGAVTPDYAYVLNIYLDDGTDTMRAVLWRETTQVLLKKTHEDILRYKEDKASFEPVKTDLLGTIILATGRTQRNESFGRTEFIINKVKHASPDDATPKTSKPVGPGTPTNSGPSTPTKPTTEEKELPVDFSDLDEELVNFDDL